jgi:hypothetical protein
MSIKKVITVTCDQCQLNISEKSHYYLKLSYEHVPDSKLAHFAFDTDKWELIFCSWYCVRKWGIKE